MARRGPPLGRAARPAGSPPAAARGLPRRRGRRARAPRRRRRAGGAGRPPAPGDARRARARRRRRRAVALRRVRAREDGPGAARPRPPPRARDVDGLGHRPGPRGGRRDRLRARGEGQRDGGPRRPGRTLGRPARRRARRPRGHLQVEGGAARVRGLRFERLATGVFVRVGEADVDGLDYRGSTGPAVGVPAATASRAPLRQRAGRRSARRRDGARAPARAVPRRRARRRRRPPVRGAGRGRGRALRPCAPLRAAYRRLSLVALSRRRRRRRGAVRGVGGAPAGAARRVGAPQLGRGRLGAGRQSDLRAQRRWSTTRRRWPSARTRSRGPGAFPRLGRSCRLAVQADWAAARRGRPAAHRAAATTRRGAAAGEPIAPGADAHRVGGAPGRAPGSRGGVQPPHAHVFLPRPARRRLAPRGGQGRARRAALPLARRPGGRRAFTRRVSRVAAVGRAAGGARRRAPA